MKNRQRHYHLRGEQKLATNRGKINTSDGADAYRKRCIDGQKQRELSHRLRGVIPNNENNWGAVEEKTHVQCKEADLGLYYETQKPARKPRLSVRGHEDINGA